MERKVRLCNLTWVIFSDLVLTKFFLLVNNSRRWWQQQNIHAGLRKKGFYETLGSTTKKDYLDFTFIRYLSFLTHLKNTGEKNVREGKSFDQSLCAICIFQYPYTTAKSVSLTFKIDKRRTNHDAWDRESTKHKKSIHVYYSMGLV